MTMNDPLKENDKVPEISDNDSLITIVLDGKTATPKAINFKGISAFQLLAIGEWLTLKGRQMIVASEAEELGFTNLAGKDINPEILKP